MSRQNKPPTTSKDCDGLHNPKPAPANLIEALGDSVGSIASGKRDLARNKRRLQAYGR
jgi:hypothetical protein